MAVRITLLPGDGIGPEVVRAAIQVLEKVTPQLTYEEALFGIAGIKATGEAFPRATQAVCEQSDAILMGAVGGPAGSTPPGSPRPESGLLALRKHFNLFANLRPVKAYPMLASRAPLREDLLKNVDILFFRELTGGAYFGPRLEMGESKGKDTAYDTMLYTTREVERIVRLAFDAAKTRRQKLTSVDKANVLASSRLWRAAVENLAPEYPEIQLEHALVDAFAMYLMSRPANYDVVVTENMFGDILTDQASVIAGSLGMLPSASLNESKFGLYEPIHGSAPDIAGRGIANPIGTILSAALMLRYSLGLEAEAARIENAVLQTLESGARTADITSEQYISTSEFTQEIITYL